LADRCRQCGADLPFFRRITGHEFCPVCEPAATESRRAAREQYRSLLTQAVKGVADLAKLRSDLPALAEQAAMTQQELASLRRKTLHYYLNQLLEDERITGEEERALTEFGQAIGGEAELSEERRGRSIEMIIAEANGGILPCIDSARLLMKREEVTHIELAASLLKETTIREWRGRSSAFSFRIVRGVSYRVGASRGRMVTVGTQLAVADQGSLTATSHRLVFQGARQDLEIPYARLLGLDVYSDGVQIHVSGRKNPPIFKVQPQAVHMLAAIVNRASQDFNN